MKKQIIATLSLSVLVLGAFAQTASALEVERNTTTHGYAQFEADENPGPSIDPGRPPTDPKEPPTGGALHFTLLPELQFDNTNVVSSTDQNYYPKYQEADWEGAPIDGGIPQKLVVEDVRGGRKGWVVTVKHDGVFYEVVKPADPTKPIEPKPNGATFNGELTFYNGVVTSGSQLEVPVMHDDLKRAMKTPVDDDNKTPLEAEVPYSLSTGVAVTSDTSNPTPIPLLTAEENKSGSGKNSLEFGLKSEATTGVKGPNAATDIHHRDGNLTPTEAGATPKVDATKEGRNRAIKLYVPVKGNNPVETEILYETKLEWTIQSTK